MKLGAGAASRRAVTVMVASAALAAAVGLWPRAAGASVRYAMIVGNDAGVAPDGLALPELLHAESEATELRDELVRLGNFDAAPERTVLLVGAGRRAILAAAARLAEQHRRDRAALGDVPTLFAFFFTGHGLGGRLLTADEPLTGADLAGIFAGVGATFTVGVFDACFSGSLDLKTLSAKGLRLLPGFNAFEALPRELIDAQGTMWLVSSGPDQVSYEDDRLGGVFTHFFMAGMEKAPRQGFGVTLDAIWEYARSHTQSYTGRAARPQTPRKHVRDLTTSGPLYFSFPAPRTAALAFEPSVQGRFLLRYEGGQLSEVVDKRAGAPLRVPAYPAEIALVRLDRGRESMQRVELRRGETVWVRQADAWTSSSALGTREAALKAKGGRLDGLLLTRSVDRWSWLVDARYVGGVSRAYSGQAAHGGELGLRFDRGAWTGRASWSLGASQGRYPAWRYDASTSALGLEVGPAWVLGDSRLALTALGGWGRRHVRFGDGSTSQATVVRAGLGAQALWPVAARPWPVLVWAGATALLERSPPVAPRGAAAGWEPGVRIGAGVAVEIL